MRAALNAELTELGNAFLALSQGFAISGQSGSAANVDGSQAIDTPGTANPGPILTPPTSISVIDVTN